MQRANTPQLLGHTNTAVDHVHQKATIFRSVILNAIAELNETGRSESAEALFFARDEYFGSLHREEAEKEKARSDPDRAFDIPQDGADTTAD